MINNKVIVEIVNINAEQCYDGQWVGSCDMYTFPGTVTKSISKEEIEVTYNDDHGQPSTTIFRVFYQDNYNSEGLPTGSQQEWWGADICDGALLYVEDTDPEGESTVRLYQPITLSGVLC